MPEIKSTIWMIPWSVTGHCCFDSSCVMFETAIGTQAEATLAVENVFTRRVLFETLDLTPEEETSLLQSVRSTFG